ncbi:MAG: PAS domain-containing sensor histidine kinase, partial [Candidatus Margulisiibacteriota bacterium]
MDSDVSRRKIDDTESYRWVLEHGIPHFSAEGNFRGYIGTCMDIEDQKQAIRARDEFLSIASHELKTPVTSLKLQL